MQVDTNTSALVRTVSCFVNIWVKFEGHAETEQTSQATERNWELLK